MVLRVSVNSALQTEMFKNSEIPTLIFLTGGKNRKKFFSRISMFCLSLLPQTTPNKILEIPQNR